MKLATLSPWRSPGARLLEPLWNLFDLTREGRPSHWEEQLG